VRDCNSAVLSDAECAGDLCANLPASTPRILSLPDKARRPLRRRIDDEQIESALGELYTDPDKMNALRRAQRMSKPLAMRSGSAANDQ
jgi:hypothetical protein